MIWLEALGTWSEALGTWQPGETAFKGEPAAATWYAYESMAAWQLGSVGQQQLTRHAFFTCPLGL